MVFELLNEKKKAIYPILIVKLKKTTHEPLRNKMKECWMMSCDKLVCQILTPKLLECHHPVGRPQKSHSCLWPTVTHKGALLYNPVCSLRNVGLFWGLNMTMLRDRLAPCLPPCKHSGSSHRHFTAQRWHDGESDGDGLGIRWLRPPSKRSQAGGMGPM